MHFLLARVILIPFEFDAWTVEMVGKDYEVDGENSKLFERIFHKEITFMISDSKHELRYLNLTRFYNNSIVA